MQTALRKMGNSTGMILPRSIPGQIGLTIGAAMVLKVEDGRLIVTPVKSEARAGWAAVAAAVGQKPPTEDEAAWQDFGNEGDTDLT